MSKFKDYSVFFAKEGEKGMNLTEAQNKKALADHYKSVYESAISNCSFVDRSISALNGTEKLCHKGYTRSELDNLNKAFEIVQSMDILIAFYSEATKAWEANKKQYTNVTFEEWLEDNLKELPEAPTRTQIEYTTLEQLINALNVKERLQLIEEQTCAAVIGKYISKGRDVYEARKKLQNVLSNPISVDEDGINTIIHYYRPSVSLEEVDSFYNTWQKNWRNHEKTKNSIMGTLRAKLDQINQEERLKNQSLDAEYRSAAKAYRDEMETYRLQYNDYIRKEEQRCAKIKLVIPKRLESAIELLNSLADK